MKQVMTGGVLLLGAFVILLLVRTLAVGSKQVSVDPPTHLIAVDAGAAAERLAGALRLATISHRDPDALDRDAFLELHAYLERSFPRVHATLKREKINEYSLLYHWQGTDAALAPVVLMSHLDVVPIAPGSEWLHDPFSGTIDDGYIWGRGALDDKFGVVAILEAIELLLEGEFIPRRSIYLAFGHDEEIGGERGATLIAKTLAERGVRAEYVIDEGGVVIVGVVPGFDVPVAVVGIAEKGWLTLELKVDMAGGHSSTPPSHTAIGIVSRAVRRLEDNQMPAEMQSTTRQMFRYLGPELDLVRRIAFANLWLFSGIVESQLAASPATNASLRTTTAVTMIEGGVKPNVLPPTASAVVNFRILPGDTADDVEAHVTGVIDDPAVVITRLGVHREASAESPTDSAAFETIQKTITQVFDDVIVAPYLVVGGTDSRHFAVLTDKIYRFAPLVGSEDDLHRMHGANERIAVDVYARGVQFFALLIENSQPE